MSKSKKLSVIMSVFNENHCELTQAIDSILDQTFKDFEFVIVLDNPKNTGVHELLTSYCEKDPRITLIANKENIGLAMSLNVAAKSCCGEYIARMDADDISFSDRLEKEVNFLDCNPEYDVVGTRYVRIDENEKEIKTDTLPFEDHDSIVEALKYGNIIVHPSVMMRRKSLEQVGYYRDFKNSQDYDLWLRMIAAGVRFYILPETLLKYRVRENSISGANAARQYSYAAYARDLAIREKAKENLFSTDDFQRFLVSKKLFADSDIKRFNNGYRKYCESSSHNKKFRMLSALLSHRELVVLYLNSKRIDHLKNEVNRRKSNAD